MQVNCRRPVVSSILPQEIDLHKTVAAERQVPCAIIVPVSLIEEIRPLLPAQTGEMLRFTLAIVTLNGADQPFGLCIKVLPSVLLILDLLKIFIGDTDFRHGSLPSCAAPALKIFIDALTFRSPESKDLDDLALSESIEMVEESHQCIAAHHGA